MSKEQKITGNIQPPNKDLEILKQNFPNCFDKNGDFDFEKFKTQLSKNEINFSKESYGMDWLGKSYARLLATDETTTLLKEDETFNQKEENKTSENLLIKGDNLEVLKHLSNAYYEKVKMIYIDPPYNTGSDGFVYADDRKFTIEELQELAGINEERAKRILDFTQSKSNSHSAWLTFMYPRLYIAKQLLKEGGVIFISIDDNEVAQLRLLMDDVFGEENFISEIIWQKGAGTQNDNKYIATNHEYILCYSKSKDKTFFYNLPPSEDMIKNYKLSDEFLNERGKHSLRNLNDFSIGDRPGLHYDIECPDGTILYGKEHRWRCDIHRYKWRLNEKRIVFEKNNQGEWNVFYKQYLFEKKEQVLKDKNGNILSYGRIPNSLLTKLVFTGQGKKEIEYLFNNLKIFDYPKPIDLVKYCATITTKNDDIVLDFFAGSGTTGDAVMQLNAEDNGNRKFILAQLPEPIDPKSNITAYDFVKNELKVETPTIFDITKERLVRASKKIQEENKGKDLSNQDLGFKVYETIPIWEDYHFEAEVLEKQISLFDETKLTQEDLKALLVTWKTYDGIPLTVSTEDTDLDGYYAHYSSEKLYLMNKGFKTQHIKALLEKIDSDEDFNPSTIIAFGYHFESKSLREISENIKSYANKKSIDIDFITRY